MPAHAPALPLFPGIGATRGFILIDGFWAGLWRHDRAAAPGRLTVTHFSPLTPADSDALTAEGLSLLTLLAPDAADPRVEITATA